ncbi:hypothetical protein [Flavobacterium aquidurense]|uniref:hypothetical protein n=1 Tax=Flavobacterium aquidurense TaxID=362413 RepID=UPI0028572815|nr:hypothetical protein [Flavobacterium aquidurense]MDR7370228.1 hypothetical protein [Flavobacterium aquidurense]
MKNYIMLLISIFFLSCQQKENKKPSVEVSDSVATNKNIGESQQKKEENKQIGDTILMNYMDEKGLFIAEGSLDSLHSKVYIKVKNEYSGKLKAQIIPATGKGNIRFNQIIFPDQSSDGPFGMEINIPLKQKGNHILIVGHSLMADNPYWGKFTIQLENKKE